MRLTGWEAVEAAKTNGSRLCKYNDPTEGARDDLAIEDAENVCMEDPSLIYLDVDPEGYTEEDEESDD